MVRNRRPVGKHASNTEEQSSARAGTCGRRNILLAGPRCMGRRQTPIWRSLPLARASLARRARQAGRAGQLAAGNKWLSSGARASLAGRVCHLKQTHRSSCLCASRPPHVSLFAARLEQSTCNFGPASYLLRLMQKPAQDMVPKLLRASDKPACCMAQWLRAAAVCNTHACVDHSPHLLSN